MVPLQTVDVDLVGWFNLLLVLLAPGAVAAVLWSPFLLAARLRALFRELPPTGHLLPTYAVVAVGAGLPYVLGTFWAVVATSGGTGGEMANGLLDVVIPLSLGYAVGVPLLGAAGLPRFGVDWDPTGYGISTWVLLLAGGTWYALLFAVPLFVIAVVLAFPA
ncbi:MAG: hypothetical protein ABEJ92_00630 [Halobacteriales archaeon]